MSREKGKVIHVDNLTIHAKEVKVIEERSRDHHEGRRHPLDFFGPRRRLGREFEEDKHESSSEAGKKERHRGPRWL